MENILVVFPQGEQLPYLLSKKTDENIYVVPQTKTEKYEELIYIDKEISVEELKSILSVNVEVLCCHEEALYWVKAKGIDVWKYPFDTAIFTQLNKESFKKYISKNGIKTAPIIDKSETGIRFPVVAKPTIGFGSIGVKKIDNEQELKEYITDYEKLVIDSSISKYSGKYFCGEDNPYILEKYISGDFYRIPFVVNEGIVQKAFPIRGVETTYRDNSDYHWTTFEYGASEKEFALIITDILQSLVNLYGAHSGTFVAEVIADDTGAYVLEFSPRQTSSRISKLIFLASEIDLELLAIDLFFNEKVSLPKVEKDIRMCIKRGDPEDIPGYKMMAIENEVSVYNDSIKVFYYEKEEQ